MIQQVISKAVSHVGYKEGPNNDNQFAKLCGHAHNQPWCATFISAIFLEAGLKGLVPNSAAVAAFEVWGKAAKFAVPISEAKRGDLIIFDFAKKNKPDHIEIAIHDVDLNTHTIQTIGGNTSNGNDTNGDGVYRRTRSAEFIRAAIRPPYKETSNA